MDVIATNSTIKIQSWLWCNKIYVFLYIVPPYFKLQLQNLTTEENSTAQFQCVARGFPAPDYEWYKGNVKISDSAHVVSGQNTQKYQCSEEGDKIVLFVRNACANDQGVYACKVSKI